MFSKLIVSFQDSLRIMKSNLKYDILSGFIVSLIALPLCLGVASASNFPPIMGVLTAIIGGLIIGLISGSELAIKGPAAGLIVIVAGAVEEYGRGDLHQGYLMTASLIAITGVMQIILGVMKIGKYADFIPSSIIHGMLAAIGIIIISKQIHLLIGISPSELQGIKPLDLIKRVPSSLLKLEWRITIIGAISLFVLYYLPHVKYKFIKAIPPFLVVIVLSIFLAMIFGLNSDKYKFFNALINPGKLHLSFNFTPEIFNGENLAISIKYFFLLTIIGTIESILTVKAVDLLDPLKRLANNNKDVIAIGIGNLIAGLFGAIPMISEVARSSANINNKAATRLSGIAHGAFLLIFIVIFSSIIKLIPVAALSSILIYVGIKLANPSDFIKALNVSLEHFLVFLTTIIVTLLEDLLVGVIAGISLKILINYLRTKEFKKLFKADYSIVNEELSSIVYINNIGVFTNWLNFKSVLDMLQGRRVIVDFTNVRLLDSAFIENIYRLKEIYKGELVFRGFMELKPVKKHKNSMRISQEVEDVMKIHLSSHQLVMKKYCNENALIISFGSFLPKKILIDFKTFRHTDIKLTDILVNGKIADYNYLYFESLAYVPVDMIEYRINALVMETDCLKLPMFKLMMEAKTNEELLVKNKNQIYFESELGFDQKYSVYTRSKEETVKIFNHQLIHFLMSYNMQDRIVDCNGSNKIMIYSNSLDRSLSDFQEDLRLAEMLASNIKLFEL